MRKNKFENNMIYDLSFDDNLMSYHVKRSFHFMSRMLGLQTNLEASSEGITDFRFKHLGANLCLLYFSFQQKGQTPSGMGSIRSKPLLLFLKKQDRRVWENSMVALKETKGSKKEEMPSESRLRKLKRYTRIEGVYIYEYNG